MKIFVLVVLIFFYTLDANEYKDIVNLDLKKDEHIRILVKYGNAERLFKFRWTLYTNGGLVILKSYDRIVSQNILYLRHKNQSFRVELRTRGASNFAIPYILVKFIEFDYEKEVAKFQLFLSDKSSEISFEYLDDN